MRDLDSDLTLTAAAVAVIQDPDGAIPWERGRHVDPWNHVEAAMGLDAAGYHHSAEAAYLWLADTQRNDGAWPAGTSAGSVVDATLDANFCAYLAAGCWHHFMLTSDDDFLRALWPVVERAIDFVLDLQMLSGAIAWARDAAYRPWPEALLTSSSSIHHSLWCAITIAERVGEDRPDWELSLAGLTAAIRQGDDGFKPKPTYAMDWYYPVLGGAVRGASALERLQRRWGDFVVEGRGVLCTDDKPWVTTGETCELAIACACLGLEAQAHELFDWVQHLRDGDGLYWTGANHPDGDVWPLEKTTWSAGSVLMAADCLQGGLTRDLFTGSALAPLPAPSLLPADPPIGAPREGFAR